MGASKIKKVLSDLSKKKISPQKAFEQLRHLPYEDLGYAKVDHHRAFRKGFPEVIYCEGKTIEQVVEIFKRILRFSERVLATRASCEVYEAVKLQVPEAEYHQMAKIITIKKAEHGKRNAESGGKRILVISAGTADMPVAEEAAVTAGFLGNKVERLYDVGVAGLHRIMDNRKKLESAGVLIVVAGMEGALASVVGGLVDKPIIAVPTSVGYGASYKGLAALLAMLNSCAPGVAVVNIDNGFGAGVMAHTILKK